MMPSKPKNRTILVLLLALLSMPVLAAKWKPPVQAMKDTKNQVVLARVLSKPSPDRIEIAIEKELLGREVEASVVELRLAAENVAAAELDGTYLIAFTKYRSNPLMRESIEIDPEGPSVIGLPVVGPAFLPPNPTLKGLLQSSMDPGDTKAVLELASSSGQLQRLGIVELYLRSDLRQGLGEKELRKLGRIVAKGGLGGDVHSYLLEIALASDAERGRLWMVADSLEILQDSTPQLALGSTQPALVITALKVLKQEGGANHAQEIAPYLGSNAPGVVKAAISAVEKLDPAAGLDAARKALRSETIHPETRRVLGRYVENQG